MTVAELVEILQSYDQDLPVCVQDLTGVAYQVTLANGTYFDPGPAKPCVFVVPDKTRHVQLWTRTG